MRLQWIALGIVAFLIYQNCGDVTVQPFEQPSVSSFKEKMNYCSDPGFGASDAVNIVFIVDMSESNVVLGLNGTMINGTDRDGTRFKAIRDFMSADCVQKKPLSKFAVMGFSTNLLINGGQACDSQLLKSVTGAGADLSFLENMQTTEKPIILGGGLSSFMLSTEYLKGIDCAESTIRSHFQTLTDAQKKTNAYMVYFLTDGLPNDNGYGSSASTNPTYRNRLSSAIDTIMARDATSAGTRVAPIFYGDNKMPPASLPAAESIMDLIAQHGNSLRTSVGEVTSVQFCQLLNSGTRVRYTVKKFGVTNLTAKMVRGHLKADSDMDGLTDEEEVALGFDPTNPRSGASGKILDGLCPAGLSADQCTAYAGIDCGDIGKFLLNKCDRGALVLTDGVDSDGDLIPDIVEILKGTRANSAERPDDNLDQDNMNTVQEIAVGRDPVFPDDDVPAVLLLNYVNLPSTSTQNCGPTQESWSVDLVNIPLVPTKALALSTFQGGLNVNLINHKEDENVILVYYILEKETMGPLDQSFLFGQFLKVNYRNPVVKWGQFMQLGVIDGQGPN